MLELSKPMGEKPISYQSFDLELNAEVQYIDPAYQALADLLCPPKQSDFHHVFESLRWSNELVSGLSMGSCDQECIRL